MSAKFIFVLGPGGRELFAIHSGDEIARAQPGFLRGAVGVDLSNVKALEFWLA